MTDLQKSVNLLPQIAWTSLPVFPFLLSQHVDHTALLMVIMSKYSESKSHCLAAFLADSAQIVGLFRSYLKYGYVSLKFHKDAAKVSKHYNTG